MKLILSILFLIFICSISSADSVSGRWIGTFNFSLNGDRILFNTSLEVEQNENYFFGILSIRNNKRGDIIGCDYLVHGEVNNKKIKINRIHVAQNFRMSTLLLISFQRAEGDIYFDETGSQIKASVFMGEEHFIGPDGTIKLKKEDHKLHQLTIDQIHSFKKKYFPDSTGNNVIQNAIFRDIAYPRKIIEKPIIEFKASSKNNPAVKVALYFDGVKLEEWSSAQDNYIEMDLKGLPEKTYIIVLKVETETTESVSFVMRRAGFSRVQDSNYTISYNKQLNLIMYIYERPS